MKTKTEKQKIKEKRIGLDIKGLLKNFFTPSAIEQTQEEAILTDATISDDQKKTLLKTLSDSKKLENKMFKDYYKVIDLSVKGFKPKEVTISQKQVRNLQDEKINQEQTIESQDMAENKEIEERF